jgi:carbonic anhydrase/acetyltransferase-like protein (isoleucine patch superfamily)
MSIRRDMVDHRIRPCTGSARRHTRRYGGAVPIYALGDQIPDIHPDAFVHPDAVIIGSVTIGADSSIWPGAVLRGDDGSIVIGARTSVQDNCVLHTTPMYPTVVGDDCVIGHIVHLEGCTIESGVLVGNGSIVLHRVVVRTGAIVAANAVVLNDTEVPAGAIAAGVPAVIKPGRARTVDIEMGVASYLRKSRRYRESLRRIDT